MFFVIHGFRTLIIFIIIFTKFEPFQVFLVELGSLWVACSALVNHNRVQVSNIIVLALYSTRNLLMTVTYILRNQRL